MPVGGTDESAPLFLFQRRRDRSWTPSPKLLPMFRSDCFLSADTRYFKKTHTKNMKTHQKKHENTPKTQFYKEKCVFSWSLNASRLAQGILDCVGRSGVDVFCHNYLDFACNSAFIYCVCVCALLILSVFYFNFACQCVCVCVCVCVCEDVYANQTPPFYMDTRVCVCRYKVCSTVLMCICRYKFLVFLAKKSTKKAAC